MGGGVEQVQLNSRVTVYLARVEKRHNCANLSIIVAR